MIDWANGLQEWLKAQGWFDYLDRLLAWPTYESFGIILVAIVIIVAVIIVLSFTGKRESNEDEDG